MKLFTLLKKSMLFTFFLAPAVTAMYNQRAITQQPIDATEKLTQAIEQHNKTALQQLINEYDQKKVALALEKGLRWAAGENNCDAINLLLNKGVAIDSFGKKGKTPLIWAAKQGHLEAAQLLLEKGASVNPSNTPETPLGWAVGSKHVNRDKRLHIINLLLNHGANLRKKDTNGLNILHTAVIAGDTEILELMLYHAANRGQLHLLLNAQESMHRRTPLHCALRYCTGARKKKVTQNDYKTTYNNIHSLINCGANPTIRDDTNRTVIGWAQIIEYNTLADDLKDVALRYFNSNYTQRYRHTHQ